MKTKLIIASAVLFVLVGLSLVLFSRHGGGNSIAVISFGGAYQDAQRIAFFKPFETSSGIHIDEGNYSGEFGLIRDRATSPNGLWDVVSVEAGPMIRAEREGLWLPLPNTVFEGVSLHSKARRPGAAGQLTFATILGYDPSKVTPQSILTWADFFNVEKFPGKRGLRDNPRQTLEIALLADGVAPNALYPLDVERALRKLNTIKSELQLWDAGAQPIQWLGNGSVVMTSVWNGRIWKAKQDGAKVAWSTRQGLWEMEFWAVPRNAPHPELALRFVRSTLQTDRQAAFANTIAYTPVNLDALPLVREDVRSAMPGADDDSSTVDADWWADNEAAVLARWQQWKQER